MASEVLGKNVLSTSVAAHADSEPLKSPSGHLGVLLGT